MIFPILYPIYEPVDHQYAGQCKPKLKTRTNARSPMLVVSPWYHYYASKLRPIASFERRISSQETGH